MREYFTTDYIDITRGPVFRVLSTPGNSAALDDSGNSVTFKEGRILSVNNSGASSVITLADDQFLEFQDDWGTAVSLDWIIIEPSYPIGVDFDSGGGLYVPPTALSVLGTLANIGVEKFPDPQAAHAYYSNAHFQRYYYVQWAAVTGVAGSNIQFTGNAGQISQGAPYREAVPAIYFGGPAQADQRLPALAPGSAPYLKDLRLTYGHDAASTSASTASLYSQLQGKERKELSGISGDVERYAYLKLEYNTTNQNQVEIIKCNLAYPIPVHWNQGTNHTASLPYGVSRTTDSSYEPPTQRTPGSVTARRQNKMPSTFAYRVDCNTVTVGYTVNTTTPFGSAAFPVIPAWDTGIWPGNAARAILPSGRGQFGTAPSPMIMPLQFATNSGVQTSNYSAELHYLGARCTDVTTAIGVSERILKRCAYGMPIVEFSTSLKHVDLQLGEFISITHPLYLRHAKNGSDTGTIFEITRKEVIMEGDSPRVDWQAAFVRQDSTPAYSFVTDATLDATIALPGVRASTAQTVVQEDFTIVTDSLGNVLKAGLDFPGLGPIWPGGS